MKLTTNPTWGLDPGASFPHMSREDSAVWRQYLLNYSLMLRGAVIEYDVQVAVKRDEVMGAIKPFEEMWQTLRSKRIDAVVTTTKNILLCEVKPTFTAAGIGQLLTYSYWYLVEAEPALPVILQAVCYRVDRDIIPLLESFHIQLITLAP